MIAELDKAWRRDQLPAWRERFDYVQRIGARLRELRAKDLTRAAVPQLLELAALEEEFGGDQPAIALYKRVLGSAPKHVAANYELGRLLLARDDETGLAALDIVLRLDDAYASAVADLAYPFLAARGRKQEAERYLEKLDERREIEAAAMEERGALEPDDPIALHDLAAPMVRDVVRELRQFPAVKRAWLVRRAVNYRILPHWQAYVLIISRGVVKFGSGWGLADDVWEAVDVPGMLVVVPDEDGYEAMRARAEAILGTRIYG
jgi:tetratricopeptide (TPR) repeat protein